MNGKKAKRMRKFYGENRDKPRLYLNVGTRHAPTKAVGPRREYQDAKLMLERMKLWKNLVK